MKQRPKSPAFLPILGALLRQIIGSGRLTVIDSKEHVDTFQGATPGPEVTIRLHDWWLPLRIALNPSLATGEAYMRGRLTIEKGDLFAFLELVTSHIEPIYRTAFMRTCNRLAKRLVFLTGGNRRLRSARNVAHHYDLSPQFYALFLDQEMHYSCAYFRNGDETLEEAQAAKVHHIAAKLRIASDQSVLDIGSGWGSLALALARETGARIRGITLSSEQLEVATRRARKAGLARRISFALEDYRDTCGQYDRIVSVGMLEHVGLKHMTHYFSKVAGLLDKDGVALVHSIGRWDANTGPDPWTEKYIFPGGHIPSLSEVIPAVEKSGLLVIDIEILRLHYAETLRHWSMRFAARRTEARDMYGEEFCRMWEFYLTAAEMSFRNRPLMVFQLQLAHRRDAVPVTRDYISTTERDLERGSPEAVGQAA